MIYLTRVEKFNAAHKLFNPNWSEEENLAFFGKCSNPNWHGHNYELQVTIKGNVHPESGFVFNAKTLGKFIKEHIIEQVDHKNMNLDVPFMKGIQPSAENICIGIFNILQPLIAEKGANLHSVKLFETEKIFVEYFGEI